MLLLYLREKCQTWHWISILCRESTEILASSCTVTVLANLYPERYREFPEWHVVAIARTRMRYDSKRQSLINNYSECIARIIGERGVTV